MSHTLSAQGTFTSSYNEDVTMLTLVIVIGNTIFQPNTFLSRNRFDIDSQCSLNDSGSQSSEVNENISSMSITRKKYSINKHKHREKKGEKNASEHTI